MYDIGQFGINYESTRVMRQYSIIVINITPDDCIESRVHALFIFKHMRATKPFF